MEKKRQLALKWECGKGELGKIERKVQFPVEHIILMVELKIMSCSQFSLVLLDVGDLFL
jgi:hypothetical protein